MGDADDPVIDSLDLVIVHPFLLTVHFMNHEKILVLPAGQV